jgi:hypothetical protein
MPSISEIASGIQTKAREVADRVTHPNRKYRHTREQSATIVSEAINAPYSEETLRKSECSYLSVAGHVLYSDDDLIELATDILARAQKRGRTRRTVLAGPLRSVPSNGRRNSNKGHLAAQSKLPKPLNEAQSPGSSRHFKSVRGRVRVRDETTPPNEESTPSETTS